MGHKKNKKEHIDEKQSHIGSIDSVTSEVSDEVRRSKKLKKRRQESGESHSERSDRHHSHDRKEKKKKKEKRVHFKTEIIDSISEGETEVKDETLILNDILINDESNNTALSQDDTNNLNDAPSLMMEKSEHELVLQDGDQQQQQHQSDTKIDKGHKSKKANNIEEGLLVN